MTADLWLLTVLVRRTKLGKWCAPNWLDIFSVIGTGDDLYSITANPELLPKRKVYIDHLGTPREQLLLKAVGDGPTIFTSNQSKALVLTHEQALVISKNLNRSLGCEARPVKLK